jgi:hypothetical protein
MNASELLSELNSSGVSLYIDQAGQLRGNGAITSAQRNLIGEHREDLIRLLQQPSLFTAEVTDNTARPPQIHPSEVCSECGGPVTYKEKGEWLWLDCAKVDHYSAIKPRGSNHAKQSSLSACQ